MGNVTAVTAQSSTGSTWTVSLELTFHDTDNHLRLPVAPLYEALQAQLGGLCMLDGQAIHGAGEFASPLEKACEWVAPLIVVGEIVEAAQQTEEPDRDKVCIEVVRRHGCSDTSADLWDAMACEGEIHFDLLGPGCNWSEKDKYNCGFEMTLAILAERTNQSQRYATAIAGILRKAYSV